MPNEEQLHPPSVQWAQRKHVIFITLLVEDSKNPTIKLDSEKLYFRGKGGAEQKEYELTLEFFKEVVAEDSRYVVRDRIVEFILKKKEDAPFWKRLTKEDKKYHWLKVDFNKWRDEDDSEDELGGNQDLEEMFRTMGGLGGGAGGEKPDMDDLDAVDGEDSDDEAELPDLE